MQAVKEDEILERLAEPGEPRVFFEAVVDILEEGADHLLRSAFRQDDYAVKYAIEPLLNREGPLSDLSVRLRLMLGLGMLSLEIYEDLDRVIKLRDWLRMDIRNYRFSDEAVLQRLLRLHCLQKVGLPPLTLADPDADPVLYLMQLERQDQVVRSSLQLALTATLLELAKESPI